MNGSRCDDGILDGGMVRLRPAIVPEDCRVALAWYQDPEVLHDSEGAGTEAYGSDLVEKMYAYLAGLGELYIIEACANGQWLPIGDVTLSRETMPIVIGVKAYRSKGIGGVVIRLLIERAAKLGWKQLQVKQIYTYNERSHRLFTRFGFQVTGEGVDDQGNRYNRYQLNLDQSEPGSG